MNYFLEYTNLNYIFTCFILAGRIKITLVRALWRGCCPLMLGVSHKQLLHGGTPPSTAGRFLFYVQPLLPLLLKGQKYMGPLTPPVFSAVSLC